MPNPEILAQEAEEAHESTGELSTGEGLPPVEFYYGKVKKNGRTEKTGKIYWIFTTYDAEGNRKRISPTKIYDKRKGITSIEQCPFKGRVEQFYWRSLGFKNTGAKNTGGEGNGGRLQGTEGQSPGKLADQ